MLSTRKVSGIGPSKAKIALVGEAPGREEDMKGEPFVGAAGKILSSILNEAGLLRSECWITNVVKHQPEDNKITLLFDDFKKMIPNEYMLDYMEELKKELEEVEPNVVVALGKVALWALTGLTEITKYRGSILKSNLVPGLKVIPTIHPAAVARQWSPWRQIVPADLIRAKKEGEFNELRLPKRTFITTPDFYTAIDELEKLSNAALLSFDIETRGFKIVSIGLSSSPDRAICIPFTRGHDNYWTEQEEIEIWKALNKVLTSPSKKIGQNFQYDALYLARYHGIIVENLWLDTMVAHHELYPETPKSLHFLASLYTDEPYWKDEGKAHSGRIRDQDLWNYNCKDAAVTYEIALVLVNELEEEGLWDAYLETMSYHEALMTMQLQGVNFDMKTQTKLIKEYEEKAKKLQESLDRAVGEPINVNSNKQMVQLLYITLNLPIVTGKTKKPTADMNALLSLRRRFPKFKPILDIIIALRKLLKLKTGFLEMEVDQVDKRIRCSYGVAGTETWRLNSSGSIFGGGTNLQNIPKEADEEGVIRKLFIPDEGYTMGTVDLSQAEARVVAWLSDDEVAISEFNEGKIDVHTVFASRLFKIPYEDLVKMESSSDPEEVKAFEAKRSLGKMVRHATNYGMSFIGLIQNCMKRGVYLEAREAKQLLKDAMNVTPMLNLYHRNVREELNLNRTLVTPLGKRRKFGGRLMGTDASATYKEGYAFTPQCVVGHLCNRGLKRIYDELGNEVDLLLQVHDEVVFQFPEGRLDLAKRCRELMEEEIIIRGRPLMIPAELKVGDSWGSLVKQK